MGDLKETAQRTGLVGQRPGVLVLEPDRPMRTLLAEWLEMAGYRFIDGHDLDLARGASAHCNVILIDVRAPLQSARQALADIAAAVPRASIVAMSADALASGRVATEAVARELGVVAVLGKPFDRGALIRAVERALAAL